MTKSTTALLRRIETENEARRQAAWEARAAPVQSRRRTKWALDHLMDAGDITTDQHDAGVRYAQVRAVVLRPPPLAGSQLVGVHPAWDMTFAAEIERAARAWSAEEARQTVAAMQAWVKAAPYTNKARMRLLERLFAYPQPSWKVIRITDNHNMAHRISALLDVMCAFWATMDAGYGAGRGAASGRAA